MATSNQEQQSRFQAEAGTFLANIGEMAPQVGLDYSVDSLQRLDQFISENFTAAAANTVSETLLVGIGSYLGEVIIRHIGGHWNEEGQPEINGLGSIEAVYPIEKARKRFENGKTESLAWYYHTVAKNAYEAGVEAPLQAQPTSSLGIARHAKSSNNGGLLGFFKGIFGK